MASAPARDVRRLALRAGVAVCLIVAEVLITSLLFSFEPDVPRWRHPVVWVRHVALLAIVAAAAFAVLSWPRRGEIERAWSETAAQHHWVLALGVNAAVFAGLTVATLAFTGHAAAAAAPPWAWFWAYCGVLAIEGVSLVWLVAPMAFWCRLAQRHAIELALALASGLGALLLGIVAASGWTLLAGATLRLAYGLLTLYEPGTFVDLDAAELGIGDFSVVINEACSGYEGVGLVTAFLILFLWTFRASLRFPNALALLPCGMVAIWLLNSVRIALLVSLGAHVSPDVAVSGFHSQAGWMMFLAVTLGLMAVAHRLPFISRAPVLARRVADPGDRLMLALLVPFMVLMLAGIIAAASAPYDRWLYGLKIVGVAATLWWFRDVYRGLVASVTPAAPLAGLVIGAAWIATDPAAAATGGLLGAWLEAQPLGLAMSWLAMRAVGAVLIVPVAEELAFRVLLYRWMISPRFETIPFSRFSWLALILSSALFGLMHERWLAGGLAGAAFAVLMIRSNRVSDPVVAHMVANAVIVLWAIVARQWSLL